MANTVVTKPMNELPEVTIPQDTDLLPVGTNQAAVMKKMTFLSLINWIDSKFKITKSKGNFAVLNVQTVTVSTNFTDLGQTSIGSVDFSPVEGATKYIALLNSSGWLTPIKVAISGTRLTCTFLNASSGGHSGAAYYTIVALRSI